MRILLLKFTQILLTVYNKAMMSVSRIFQILFLNRPFPKCPKPLFQSEAKCEAIDMKMFFYSHVRKTHFHKKGTFRT